MTPTELPVRRRSLGRDLVLWFGSFLMAATALVVYVRVPIFPLMVAGGLTLAITVVRYFAAAKKRFP